MSKPSNSAKSAKTVTVPGDFKIAAQEVGFEIQRTDRTKKSAFAIGQFADGTHASFPMRRGLEECRQRMLEHLRKVSARKSYAAS